MSTINLADVSKNSKEVQQGLKEWERANPAELIECMQRRGELKHLKAKSYDKAYRPRMSVKTDAEVPDAVSGLGFKAGDKVTLTLTGMQAASLSGLPQYGIVTGIRDGFIRVGRELYSPKMWRKV